MSKARVILAIASICIALWVGTSVCMTFQTTPDQIKLVPYDEYVGKMFDVARFDVDKFFEIAVLIVAGLWAVAIIGEKNRLSWCSKDTPEIIMFGAAMVLLFGFFYFDYKYYEVLTTVYWDIGKLPGTRMFPDFLHSPYLDLHRRVLVRCFYSGMVVSGMTAFSQVRLKSTG